MSRVDRGSGAKGSHWWGTARALLLLAGVLSAVFIGGGCGEQNGDGGGDSSSKEPVKVGVVNWLTGTYKAYGSAGNFAVQVWADEVNAAGGILGRKVELLFADGTLDSNETGSSARKVLAEGAEVVYVDNLQPGVLAVAGEAQKAGKMAICPTATQGGPDYNSPSCVFSGDVSNQLWEKFVPFLVEKSGKPDPNCYIIASDYGWGKASAWWIKESLKKTSAKLVGEEYIAIGATDYSGTARRILDAKTDVLLYADLNYFTASKALQDYGAWCPDIVVGSCVHSESYLPEVGTAWDGLYVSCPWFSTLTDSQTISLKEKFLAKDSAFNSWDGVAAKSYGIMKLWSTAVEQVGTFDVEPVLEAMRGSAIDMPGTTGFGLIASEFCAGLASPYNIYAAQYKDGKPVVVEDFGPIDNLGDQTPKF